jgi:hypothetical protein
MLQVLSLTDAINYVISWKLGVPRDDFFIFMVTKNLLVESIIKLIHVIELIHSISINALLLMWFSLRLLLKFDIY